MTKPFQYQKEAVHAIDEKYQGKCLISLPMGLGKTLIALLYTKRHPETKPVIVVCPASLKINWEREAAHHVGMRAEILDTKKVPKHKIKRTAPIIIINYDILKAWLPYLQELQPGMVIIDEGQYLQSLSSQRTKACITLCKNVDHILVLSGTPLTNRPRDLYPILKILRPKLYPTFSEYGTQFCGKKRVPWGSGWDYSGASNLDVLHRILKKEVMYRKRKEDVIDQLPEKIRHILPVEIGKKQRKEYELATNKFITWMARKNPTKLKKAERAQRLVQLGYLKRLAAEIKMPAVMEWIDNFLEGSEGKLLVFGIHKNIIAQLEERYKKICVVVSGKVKKADRQLAVDRFQKNPKFRLFIGNIKAAGVGLTLTKAHDVAFVEIGWTPGEHSQAEDRCYGRVNDMHGATVTYLIAENTIESKLIKLIHKKQRILNAVMDGQASKDFDLFNKLTMQLIGGD